MRTSRRAAHQAICSISSVWNIPPVGLMGELTTNSRAPRNALASWCHKRRVCPFSISVGTQRMRARRCFAMNEYRGEEGSNKTTPSPGFTNVSSTMLNAPAAPAVTKTSSAGFSSRAMRVERVSASRMRSSQMPATGGQPRRSAGSLVLPEGMMSNLGDPDERSIMSGLPASRNSAA